MEHWFKITEQSFEFCFSANRCHFQTCTTPSIFEFEIVLQFNWCRLFSYNNINDNLIVTDTYLRMFGDMEVSEIIFLNVL